MNDNTSLARQDENRLAKPLGTKDTLEGLLAGTSFQNAVKTVLPTHLKPERILKMALVAASRQPLLYKCTQASVLQSLMRSAELGLDCSGTLGLGYLVPFWNSKVGERGGYECQFIPGYRGIIDLAKRANPQMQIEARVVFANDTFDFEYGLRPRLMHKPTTGDQGDIVYFYCISRQPDLEPEFTVMTRAEVDAIKNRSNAKDKQGNVVGPWKSDYAEMGRKTVTKRHSKYLALSVEVQNVINVDDEQYRTGDQVALAHEVSQSVGLAGMKERMASKDDAIDVEATPADYVDQSIHTRPNEAEPATDTETPLETESVDTAEGSGPEGDIDPLDKLRADVTAALDELPKNVQKNLMAGKALIKEMDSDDLNQMLIEIRKAKD